MASCNRTTGFGFGTAYRGTALGFNAMMTKPLPVEKPKHTADAGPCDADVTPNLCNASAHPHAYDALTLPGLLAYPLGYSAATPDEPMMRARILRAASRGGATYACGVAAVPVDGDTAWEMEGFACVSHVSAAASAVPPSVCVLRATDVLGTTRRLTSPRAIVPVPCSATAAVVVVGNGSSQSHQLDAPVLAGPALAVIPVCGGGSGGASGCASAGCAAPACVTLPTPSLCVLADLGEEATFCDAMWHVEQPGTWLVVAGCLGADAMLWVIDVATCAVMTSATLVAGDVSAAALCAVSVTYVSGMYVAGVHVTELAEDVEDEAAPSQSLLWPVVASTFGTLAPWSATNFNQQSAPDTPRLRAAPSALTNLVLRVFGVPSTGAVMAATLVRFDQSGGAPLPAHGAAVYAFTADTDPDTAFGVDGVTVWFDAELGTTRPNDAALLLPDGASTCQPRVVIVGNSLETETLAAGIGQVPPYPAAVDVPGFAFLNVYMGTPIPVPAPVPFAVVVGASGVTTLVRGLGADRDCCSPAYRWMAAVAQSAPGALALMGDVCWHPGCMSQSASLLAVLVALSCPPRILNAQAVSVPIVNNNCNGRVEVDARCAPTTLLVRGGVVLSCDALAVPGSLRFNADTDALELCTASGAWRPLAFLLD